MRSILIIVYIILQLLNSLHSQYVYFNNRYSPYEKDSWSVITNILEVSDGFISAGATCDSLNSSWKRVGLFKIDFQGTILSSKSYGDNNAMYFTGWSGSFVKKNSNLYLAGSKQYFMPEYNVSIYLYRLLNNLDTLWTKEYFVDRIAPVDTFQWVNSMDICENGELIFTGAREFIDLPVKILFFKADTSGNVLFENCFGTSGYNVGYSIIQTPYKGFAIGGFWYIPGSSVYTGDPIVIKTDSLGNQEWKKNLGEQYKDNKALLCLSPEGDIIVGTVIADSMMGNAAISKIQIAKLNINGDIIWKQKYGEALQYNFLSRIICQENGSIIAVGSVFDYNPDNIGWMIKVASNGDSLWYRTYNYLKGEESDNYFYDVALTSDNGFIVGGYMYPKPPDTGIQDSWVIKLDSMGCDTPGCNPGVWVPEDLLSENYLDVYPNPTTNRIFCQISVPVVNSEIWIYDVYGRLKKVTKIPERQSEISLDVSSFTNGLYLMVIKDHQKVLGSRKFIVRR